MNGFFNFRKLVVGVMAATCFMGFQSCLDDDDDYPYSKVLPNALVTVKPVDDGSYFLQLDDSTTLLPLIFKGYIQFIAKLLAFFLSSYSPRKLGRRIDRRRARYPYSRE